jgi:putative glutamine amidotransferase
MPDLFEVNSLHVQGVEAVGPALAVEARADDGLVEAVSATNSSTFALGVQWHPEWYIDSHPINHSIFKNFGAACLHRLRMRSTVD